MKNLLIIEPHMSGHHSVYLQWIVRAALKEDCRVLIGTFEDNLTHPLFKTIIQESPNILEIFTLPTPVKNFMKDTSTGGLLRREVIYRKIFGKFYNKAMRSFQVDRVFIPYLDYCTNAIAMLDSPFGQTSWAGITMRTAFHYNKMGIIGPDSRLLWFKKILFYRLVQGKSLCALFTIDPTLFMYIKKKRPFGSEKVHYLPYQSDFEGNISKDAARQTIKIPQNAVLILVYGAISLRKGLDALLNTVATQEALSNIHILLAGIQEPETESLLKSCKLNQLLLAGRLHQMNKFVSEEEEYLAFKASDIVWLGYREHYTMSGVIIQAGRMGLPVISCKEGVIGWLTKKHNLGIVIDELNEKYISKSVQKLIVNDSICIKYGESGKRYFSSGMADQFVKTISAALV